MPSSPRVVLLGDIGRPNFYHLGDEAMTEGALTALRARGITDVTLVAADPEVARTRYDTNAVPGLGLAGNTGTRREHVGRLMGFRESLSEASHSPTLRAIEQADALIIAGGGNISSEFRGQLMERVAFGEAAEYFGKPLFISSQTIGPRLVPDDAELVRSVARYATCVGAREPGTMDLLDALDAAIPVVLTPDDAALVTPKEPQTDVPDRFAIASFKSGTMKREIEAAAAKLDQIAEENELTFLTVSHVGRFDNEDPVGDQITDLELAAASRGGIRRLPQLTSAELAYVSARAVFSTGNRYHPAVFSTAAGSAAYPVADSHYSIVRMRGALSHLGLQDMAVSEPLWRLGHLNSLIEATRDAAAEHVATHHGLVHDYLGRWWDAIAGAIKHGDWVSPGDLHPAPRLQLGDGWLAANTVGDDSTKTLEALPDAEKLRKQLREVRSERDHLKKSLASSNARLHQVSSRRVIQFADGVGDVARRVFKRPNGGE